MKKTEHKFLKFILPAKALAAVEADTRKWEIVCPGCNLVRDAWDAGLVLYKARIQGKAMASCPSCGVKSMHTISLKREGAKGAGEPTGQDGSPKNHKDDTQE